MFRRSLAAAAALLVIASAAPSTAADAKYEALFDRLWTVIDQNFYDPGFHGVDWKAAGARYRAKLASVHTDAQFSALATAMLGELKSSHLYVVKPKSSADYTTGIGVRFDTVGGRATVVQVSPLSDARRKGVRVGDQLVGSTAGVAGPLGAVKPVTFEGCDGRVRILAVRRESALWPPEHPGWSWRTLSPRHGFTVGYIRADRFDDGAAELADLAMAEMKSTDALIIDVRQNTGGNMSALRLTSYFTSLGDAPVLALFARPYLAALGHPVTKADVLGAHKAAHVYTDEAVFKAVSDGAGGATFYNEDMGAKRYAKPVVVLTGEDTGSAGDGFARFMHEQTKAVLMGRPTAGEILSGEEFTLGDGWTVTLPAQGLWNAEGQDIGDQAVKPDVAFPIDRRGLCEGRDADIERALDFLSAEPKAGAKP